MYDYAGSQSPSLARSTPATPMLEELAGFDAEIERLGKHCEILEQRLMPVLRPELPSNPTIAAPRERPEIPLIGELRNRRDRIDALCNKIISIHERIGV